MEVECLSLRDLISPKKSKADIEDVGGRNDQKENRCVERRRTTPHKMDTTATMLLYGSKAPTPEHLHGTPVKPSERGAPPHADPWTPTANLRMLISAASPDIRDREMKKVLFRPIENERALEDVEVDGTCQFDVVDEEEEEGGETKPSRKQKSLGLLCQKFLALYPDYPTSDTISISLDEVSTSLGVERRRIYDIVNVLESLMIVGRVAKNQYVWYGRRHLGSTLAELQGMGRQQRYHLHMEQPEEGGEADSSCAAASTRKDKSLRIMSQKFVMLFLVSRTQTVTLDVAAKILIEESQDPASHSKYKTKVRRLYDIANVLTSLGLIKKVHVREERGRKPAFKWIGPADFHPSHEDSEAVEAIALPGGRKQKLARHASFSVVPTSVASQRLVNSAPSSPRREVTGLLPQPVDYSRKCVSSSAVCRLRFGTTVTGASHPSGGHRSPTHSDGSSLLCSPGLSPLAVPIHPEGPYVGPLSPHPPEFTPHPHHMAYLPSLSQASVVMLYGGPAAQEGLNRLTTEVQRSSGSGEGILGKRKRDEGAEEEKRAKKDTRESPELSEERKSVEGRSVEGNSLQMTTSPRTSSPGQPGGLAREEAPLRDIRDGEVGRHSPPNNQVQPSHYLYVPNSAGLNSLNFLLSAGQTPDGLTLPAGTMPTLTLPYVLVSSSTLSPYPLMANGGDAHANLNFNMSAMMSPACFVMGAAGPYAVARAPEFSGLAVAPALSSPEQHRLFGSGPIPPHSPLEPRPPLTFIQTETQTPQTPKEAAAGGGSKAFFQTPGTLGTATTTPVARRRGSAQRRLDIGHLPTN
ncbi:transcription factor E2F7 [Coregonus clupeaformis]|uniref:transcription factor E2F7 n=1 Tax=Coregonus clupeaformis TaxID=59861 RepID=UPI001E1C63E8|nr:transcription factor E2F7 [Coregonus clupeaformis]